MEPLIITKVRLRDFLSHRDTEVEFIKGVNVLIGPNGAGKSSVLEAIYFALTGRGWRTPHPKQRASLKREGAQTAEVVLEFEMGGRKYVVHRFIEGNRRDIIRVDGKVVAQGSDSVSDYISTALGLTHEQIRSIVLIPQGGITRLFTQLGAAKRKETIDKLLGLHTYHEVGEAIKEVAFTADIGGVPKTFRPRKRELMREARKLAESLSEKQAILKEQIEGIKKEIGEVRARLKEIEGRAAELEKAAARYEEVEDALSKARAEKEALEARIRDAEAEAERLRQAVEEAEEELSRLEEEAGRLESRARLAGLRGAVEELGRLIERVSSLEERLRASRTYLGEVERKLKRIRELEEALPAQPEELRESLRRVEALVEGLTEERASLMTKIGRVRERAISVKEEIERGEEGLREAAAAVAEAVGEAPPAEELIEAVEALLKEFSEKGARIEEEINTVSERVGALRSGIEDSRRKLALIERAEEPRCPLCGSPLTPEHRERIVRELREGIAKAEEELRNLERRLEELRRAREELRRRASLVTPDLLKTVRYLIQRNAELREELVRLREEERLASEKLARVEEELRKAEAEEERLRRAVSTAELLEELRKGFDELEYERLKAEVKGVEEELARARERAETLVSEVVAKAGLRAADPAKVYAEARELVEGAEEAARKLAEVRARAEEVRARLAQARKDLAAREASAKALREGLEELARRVEALSKELEEVRRAREELERLRGEEAALKERLSSLEERLSSLTEELEKLRKAVEEAKKAFRAAYVASWLAEHIYSRDGLPKKVRPKILRLLETYIQRNVDKFNLGFQDIRIDEDYEISLVPVNNPRVRRLMRSLSGGEQVSLSMAALLAMFNVVSGSRVGFMALDEPTEYLDEERQRALVELFRMFQGGKILPQLIIVTHDESIKEVADRIYLVEKVDGVSRVRLVEPGEWE